MTTSDSQNSLLLSMPDDVMRRILGECDYVGVQTLRKTCHSLRNFIDDTLSDPSTLQIKILVKSDVISLDLGFLRSDFPLGVVYHKSESGVLVEKQFQRRYDAVSPEKFKLLENLDLMDSFFLDFDVLLRFLNSQKSEIQRFDFTLADVDGSKFCTRIQKSFRKNQILKCSSLYLRIHQASEVISFLPYFSAGILEKIQISNSKVTDNELDLEQISELEQWKKAKTLEVNFFTVRGPRRFLDSEQSVARFTTITVEEARMLVENFRTSHTFPKSCQLNYTHMDETIPEALGAQPLADIDYLGRARRRWFWKTVDPEKLLLIQLNQEYIHFMIIGWERFPQSAILHEG